MTHVPVHGHLTMCEHFSKQSARIHVARALIDFRLLSTEQKTPQPLLFIYIYFLLFYEDPEVSPWSNVAVIFIFISCLCRFLKVMVSSLSCQLNPSIDFANHPNGTNFKTWTAFQIKLYFQNRGACLSGHKHMDSENL